MSFLLLYIMRKQYYYSSPTNTLENLLNDLARCDPVSITVCEDQYLGALGQVNFTTLGIAACTEIHQTARIT